MRQILGISRDYKEKKTVWQGHNLNIRKYRGKLRIAKSHAVLDLEKRLMPVVKVLSFQNKRRTTENKVILNIGRM